MKTNYSDMAKRYKLAEEQVWAKLENWQKLAITEDRANKKNSSQFESFSKQVIELAESVDFVNTTTSKSTKKVLTPTNN